MTNNEFPKLPKVKGVNFKSLKDKNGIYYYWVGKLCHNNKTYEKWFSVTKHGYGKAYIMAIDFRRQIEEKVSKIEKVIIKYEENNHISPMKGVICREIDGNPIWIARVYIKGQRLQKRFSALRYGYEEARGMAIKWRLQKLEEKKNYIE